MRAMKLATPDGLGNLASAGVEGSVPTAFRPQESQRHFGKICVEI